MGWFQVAEAIDFPGSSTWSLANGAGDSSAEQRPVSQVSQVFSPDPRLENVYWRMLIGECVISIYKSYSWHTHAKKQTLGASTYTYNVV